MAPTWGWRRAAETSAELVPAVAGSWVGRLGTAVGWYKQGDRMAQRPEPST